MKGRALFSPARWREFVRVRLYCDAVRRLTRLHRLPDVDMSLRRLKDRGFSPRLVFDIGAYEGEFLTTCWRLWPDCRVVAFEPQADKAQALREKFGTRDFRLEECLVGDEDRDDVPFYVDANASSVLFSEAVNSQKDKITKRMVRLDSYRRATGAAVPDLLQIDTLSFEYQILRGMGEDLRAVEAILVQLNFIEVFQEVKLAHEVIAYLAGYGFVLYDVCDVHRRPLDNALWQMDCLFVPSHSPLRRDKRWG